MSEYGILLIGHGRTGPMIDPPVWVKSFDPDFGPEGTGYPTGAVESTDDPVEAIRFPSIPDAVQFARQQSTRTPLRPDGRPNRPMTAFTIQIERLPE